MGFTHLELGNHFAGAAFLAWLVFSAVKDVVWHKKKFYC